MKKVLSLTLVALLILSCFTLAGCSGENAEDLTAEEVGDRVEESGKDIAEESGKDIAEKDDEGSDEGNEGGFGAFIEGIVEGFEALVGGFTGGNAQESLEWIFDRSTGTLTISGKGPMGDTYLYDGVRSIVIEEGVTSIGNDSLSAFSELVSISIPSSVTSIGWHAFSGCRSLASVTVPGSVRYIDDGAFSDCTSLASVTVLDGVTFIGNDVFSGCSALTEVTLPDSVVSVGWNAFDGCDDLQYREKDGVKYLGNKNNPYAVVAGADPSITSATLAESTKCVGAGAFSACDKLQYHEKDGIKYLGSETNPYMVVSMGHYTIDSASPVDTARYIASMAFAGCLSLSSITVPYGVTSIGESAFLGCESLAEVVLPDSVTSIGCQAFSGCDALNQVHYGGTVDQAKKLFEGTELNRSATIYCTDGELPATYFNE